MVNFQWCVPLTRRKCATVSAVSGYNLCIQLIRTLNQDILYGLSRIMTNGTHV